MDSSKYWHINQRQSDGCFHHWTTQRVNKIYLKHSTHNSHTKTPPPRKWRCQLLANRPQKYTHKYSVKARRIGFCGPNRPRNFSVWRFYLPYDSDIIALSRGHSGYWVQIGFRQIYRTLTVFFFADTQKLASHSYLRLRQEHHKQHTKKKTCM